MNTPNVFAGRLERRVRRVGNETMPGVHGFFSLLTALFVGIAVGRPVTRPPPHRSRRAELPLPSLLRVTRLALVMRSLRKHGIFSGVAP
jgi:hypothetical protein